MFNFDEFKKELTDLCTYYQIPINSLVIAGKNASELNILYAKNDKESLNENKRFTNTIALFAIQSSFSVLKNHFTTTSKKTNVITFTINETQFVVFQQGTPLDIRAINNIKFLNKAALREFRYGVPDKYSHY